MDQAASSATNFLLTIVVARKLGPESLGTMAIGFTIYLIALGFSRGLISQPLVVRTAALDAAARQHADRTAATSTLVGGVLLAVVLAVIGFALGGTGERSMLLFAPWLPGALLQDLWRAVLFRDGQGKSAALNDALWLLAMVPCLAAATTIGSLWTIVASWGIGGVVASLFGVWQTHVLPTGPLVALPSWYRTLWPFGRWLALSGAAYNLTTQMTVFVVGVLLGADALGGLRAVQTVFAPLSLLIPAIALPALPATARRLQTSGASATAFAWQTSGLVVALTTAYVVAIEVGGAQLLNAFFGTGFDSYEVLLLPIAVQQLLIAAGSGFDLLLTARKHGRALVVTRIASGVLAVLLVSAAAWHGSLTGVAWCAAAAAGAASLFVAAFALTGVSKPGAGEGRVPTPIRE